VARRAKSYSDFYQVVRAQLAKDAKKAKERRESVMLARKSVKAFGIENMIERHEDELLDASQEGFRYTFLMMSSC
jgi:hypothetical protein